MPACFAAHGRFAQKLLGDLLSNYSSALRPVEDTQLLLNVTLQITLSQIIDMDERNQILTTYLWIRQVWMDAYLSWRKEDYDGLDTLRIPSRLVWRPDIVLYNSADDQFSSSMETNVVLRHDGQVMWDQPAITKSSCSVDVAFFPFDVQQCPLTFGSWTHNGNQMDLFNALDTADLSDFVPNVEWEVLGMPAKKNVILYGCCSDPYPDITFSLHLKRRASFYIFNLLIPCMMISFLAPLGFFLPADSGEKVSLGVTVLLALTVFQLLVAESMPPSESVPLIGKYYIATMTMVTASTALTIFIMNIHHCGPEARPVPRWAERLVLDFLARICFVSEVGKSCLGGGTSGKRPLPQEESDSQSGAGARGPDWETGGSVSVEQDPTKRGVWKEDLFVAIDHSEGGGAAGGGGGGGRVRRGEGGGATAAACICRHQPLCSSVEFIAGSYRDQRTAQLRVAEWRAVAKVMDRFFMWLFFIMFFFMSVLILGKNV
ncbi:LOW QUALITY PROTEIN: neuronal acetylcholine receptor subunit alpha-10-like [Menidia menidia]